MKLINLCEDIVNKEICVERILKRLYLIDNKLNLIKNEDYLHVNNIIDSIIYKSYMETKDKSENMANINNEVK